MRCKCTVLMVVLGCCAGPLAFGAQLGKAHDLLLRRGLQIQGMVTRDDVFHLNTYSNAGFTSINWLWDSKPALMGAAPGYTWSRWVNGQTNMPGSPASTEELPFLPQLLSLQLADEWDLNNDSVRERAVNWFNAVRAGWPAVVLYGNNWGGQLSDKSLGDFVTRARPDMLCFDGYPFQCEYNTNLPSHTGSPIGWDQPNSLLTRWYGDLRQYRAWALKAKVPMAIYRQTFHSVQDYNQTVYRDPSPSELRLNTFAALAFNAKWLINFTYNTGASSLFTKPGGDSHPTPLYYEQADVNRRALNLGKALVRLTPIDESHERGVSSMLFLRGRYLSGGKTNWTNLPNSFLPDPEADKSSAADPSALNYSWWEFGKNDPYLSGWSVTNRAGSRNNGLPGEVIIAWFKAWGESLVGAEHKGEIYIMVVNALTAVDGAAAECRQEITLNFVPSVPRAVVFLDPLSGIPKTNVLSIIPGTGGRRRLTLNLDGGDAALFKFDNGAPFVGVAEVR